VMVKKQRRLILILIVLLAFGLRFYRLADYPALNADEAAIGYNAFSLAETGRDEHGNSWPIHFQSFNDYKPGLYFYMVLPFIKLLGLTVWAVRIPGALLGVVTVYVLYLLVREVFDDERQALVASLFLAISPWHIHFSRGGWEVSAATALITLGMYLFIRALKNSSLGFYAFSVVAFVASLYTYHAARVIVPFLGLGFLVTRRKQLVKEIKKIILAGVLGLLLLLPLVRELVGPQVVSRAAGVGLLADPGPFARINEQRGEHGDFAGLVPKVMHNKLVNYGLEFVKNWMEHFDGGFLFLSGDEVQRNRVPETGEMYLVDWVFILVAACFVARKPKGWGIILWWLAVAPLGAALTFQSPHALRAHNMVIPLIIISAYGAVKMIGLIGEIGKVWVRRGLLVFLLMAVVWNFARYQRMYWLHMAKEYPFSSQYGIGELVSYIKEEEGKFEKVIVTNRYDQPYILFLFYLKYPPTKFQGEHQLTPRDIYGFSTVRNFDKYYFNEINYDSVQPENPNSLIVGTDEEIPDEANVVKEIYGSNGYEYFQVVAN
jgi:4-amino-4-deoxy-L-arabinose transferase-like glycosyltransferase